MGRPGSQLNTIHTDTQRKEKDNDAHPCAVNAWAFAIDGQCDSIKSFVCVIQPANGSGRVTAAVRLIGSGENESEGEVKAGSEFAVTCLPPSRSLTTLHHPQRRLRQCRKKLLSLVHCCRSHSKGHP